MRALGHGDGEDGDGGDGDGDRDVLDPCLDHDPDLCPDGCTVVNGWVDLDPETRELFDSTRLCVTSGATGALAWATTPILPRVLVSASMARALGLPTTPRIGLRTPVVSAPRPARGRLVRGRRTVRARGLAGPGTRPPRSERVVVVGDDDSAQAMARTSDDVCIGAGPDEDSWSSATVCALQPVSHFEGCIDEQDDGAKFECLRANNWVTDR